jgi:hypothetical protein
MQDTDPLETICAADISGPRRGVPDGLINVQDVNMTLVQTIQCHRRRRRQPA